MHFSRISPGTSFVDAVYEHSGTPSAFYKSRVSWTGSNWELRMSDGTVLIFPEAFNATTPAKTAMIGVRDRRGNAIHLKRDTAGQLLEIQSVSGRFVRLSYDEANRISKITDNAGRITRYLYDGPGRLTKVTSPDGTSVKTSTIGCVHLKTDEATFTCQMSMTALAESSCRLKPMEVRITSATQQTPTIALLRQM